MADLPKYIQKANKIIELIAAQPDQIWAQTQRKLGEELGFSQPELSNLLSTLAEAGRIRKGHSLPGVRGRNYTIELVDATLLDSAIPRRQRADRPLAQHEIVEGPVDLQSLTLEQIGAAVIRTIRETWDKAERATQMQSEHMGRIRDLKEELAAEKTNRERYLSMKDSYERQIAERDDEIQRIRGELNQLIVAASERRNGKENSGSFQVKEMLSDSELHVLENLMKAKPGFSADGDEKVAKAS